VEKQSCVLKERRIRRLYERFFGGPPDSNQCVRIGRRGRQRSRGNDGDPVPNPMPRQGKWDDGISIPCPCPNGHRVPMCRRSSVGANRPPRFRCHALTGHRIPAQGANPGNPPGKRDPRSEGTPHSLRVSDIDPGHSYAVFLQNTLFSRVRFPGRCPGWYALPRWGKLRFPGRCPGWYALPRQRR